jgi:hypothetical protein
MSSNVGSANIYEAGDQRNYKQSELHDRERYQEGKPNSHLPNDSSTWSSHNYNTARTSTTLSMPLQPQNRPLHYVSGPTCRDLCPEAAFPPCLVDECEAPPPTGLR